MYLLKPLLEDSYTFAMELPWRSDHLLTRTTVLMSFPLVIAVKLVISCFACGAIDNASPFAMPCRQTGAKRFRASGGTCSGKVGMYYTCKIALCSILQLAVHVHRCADARLHIAVLCS